MSKLKILAVMFCVMVMALAANASMVTHTISFGDSFDGGVTTSHVLSVPQFDLSLGSLQSVTIDFGIAAEGFFGFENTSEPWAGERSVSFHSIGDLQMSFDGNSIAAVDWNIQQDHTFWVEVYDGVTDYAGPSGWSTVYMNEVFDDSLFYDIDLAAFIGNGTLDFDLAGTAWMSYSSSIGTQRIRTLGSSYVTVTYEYVPEPTTVALLGLGGLALIRKKRNA